MNRQGGNVSLPPNAVMSVDAKLAAQAASSGGGNQPPPTTRAGSSGGSSNSNTPKLQQQQQQQHSQQQQQHAQHLQHHHQSQAGLQQSQTSSHRSKKEEYLLLSLPSHDSARIFPAHYETGDDVGYNGSDGEDSDWTAQTTYPHLSNRGHKLDPGARFIRKGRLGGWENREFLDGKSDASYRGGGGGVGPSAKSILPSMDSDSLLGDELRRPQAGMPGGKDVYPITPNLTFVPSSSTAAARPDREPPAYSFLPGPNSPTSPSSLSARKRKKVYSSYTGLASTSGSTSNHTSAPVRAYLPAPPQNPIELVMSPLVTRTFSPRNNSLEKLSLHATDLIERDLPLVKALTRVVDILRGTTVAGLDGALGLPFSNDNEKVIDADIIQDKEAEAIERNIEAEEQNATAAEAEYLASRQKVNDETTNAMDVDGPETAQDITTNGKNAASNNPRKRARSGSMEVETEGKSISAALTSDAAPIVNGSAVDSSIGATTVAAADAVQDKADSEENKPVALSKVDLVANGTEAAKLESSLLGGGTSAQVQEAAAAAEVTANNKTAEQAMSSNEAVHDKADLGASAAVTTLPSSLTSTKDMELDPPSAIPPIIAASIAASRQNSPSVSGVGEDDNDNDNDSMAGSTSGSGFKHNPPTRLPLSLQRIANPAPYISSLLVSDHDVKVAIPPGAPAPVPGVPGQYAGSYQWIDLLLPSGPATLVHPEPEQPVASTSTSTSVAAAGGAASTSADVSSNATQAPANTKNASTPFTQPEFRSLSAAEQQEAVYLCTQELTKFLSDTLEYRDRLCEIRDSIMGVEKRRKGVWTMARSYAHQLLWEEEQDKIAQGL
jgi:hypothetical protein